MCNEKEKKRNNGKNKTNNSGASEKSYKKEIYKYFGLLKVNTIKQKEKK